MNDTTQTTPAVIEKKKSRFSISPETRQMIVKNVAQTVAYAAIGIAIEITAQAVIGGVTKAHHSIFNGEEEVEEIDESIKDL